MYVKTEKSTENEMPGSCTAGGIGVDATVRSVYAERMIWMMVIICNYWPIPFN